MKGKRGQGDSSPVAIFAIIVVVLIAIFAFVAYSQGYFPFREQTTTVVVQDNDDPDTIVVRETPIENTYNSYNNTFVVDTDSNDT